MKDFGIALVVLGLGGAILWVLWDRSKAAPPQVVDNGMGQCGASYVGVGASVPCELLAKGVKTAYEYTSKALAPVGAELKTAASGIKPWEVVITPVAISHVAYNELKRLNPF